MKKIIIPFDGDHFSKGAFAFASSMHEVSPVLLTGVFLPEVDYARFFFFPAAFAAPAYMPTVEDYELHDLEINIEKFTALCQKNMIEYRVHKDVFGSSISELSKESRFADVMIIGSETFYKKGISAGSDEYLKDALRNAECPVIIVPEETHFPSQIILTYDGSASSVFAIREFAHLFPELCDLKTTLVYASADKKDVPDRVLIEELATRHFKDLSITRLPFNDKKETAKWLAENDDAIVVSGSFARSELSQFFHRSFIIDVIKKHKIPVFVAHK